VYLAFKYPSDNNLNNGDWLVWVRSWEPGVSIDLGRLFEKTQIVDSKKGVVPNSGKQDRVCGRITFDWQQGMWNDLLRGQVGSLGGEGKLDRMEVSFPILTFFDRLEPIPNPRDTTNRVDLLRRSARHLDRSAALAAGAMVIIAKAYGPLPTPLQVEGDPITGDGPIYYQFVLPLDHSAMAAPATQPSVDASK